MPSPEVAVGIRVLRKIYEAMAPDAGRTRLCDVVPIVGEKIAKDALVAIMEGRYDDAHELTYELRFLSDIGPVACPAKWEEAKAKVAALVRKLASEERLSL